MQNRAWGNEYRMTLVCVDDYQDSILRGRLYNPYFSTGNTFRSLMEFFRTMEELLDGMQFPQSFTAARTFADSPQMKAVSPPGQEVQEGRCATFAVRVLFRQNATWQGSVTWLEGGREESFRSALELAFLMDSALLGKKPKDQKRTPVSP
jgi:hypothetical protein